jgi:biopolymer transport protein TolR
MAMSLGGSGLKAQINMTPMIDVLLVLIIIFLVILPQVPTGLDAALPETASADSPRAATNDVVITVLGNGALRVNEEPTDVAKLPTRLLQIFGAGSHNVVFIRGEKDLDFAEIAEVIDIVKGVGVDRVGLLTR